MFEGDFEGLLNRVGWIAEFEAATPAEAET